MPHGPWVHDRHNSTVRRRVLTPHRFKEYRALVPGISDPQLTLRLKQLQGRRLIERTVIPSTPVQIMYALTPDAEELISLLQPLAHWSERHLPHRDA